MSRSPTSSKAYPTTLNSRRLALEALVARDRPRVLGRLSKTVEHVDAEDMYQEACVRALERLSQQQHPAQMRAWFDSVLRTVVSRRYKSRLSTALPVAHSGMLTDTAPSPCRCGFDVLATLSQRQQNLLRRSVLEDCSTQTLAREEHTTANNVRVLLHRARARLRTRWEHTCEHCMSDKVAPGCRCNPSGDT